MEWRNIEVKGKSETEKTKMRVNPEFLRRGYLKKQSQFSKGQNDVKTVLIMGYGDFDWPRRRKNKAKQSQFIGVQCSADSAKMRKRNLKKQSQFQSGQNEFKCLYEREI